MNKRDFKKLTVLGVCQGQGALLFPFKRNLIGNIEPRGCFHTPGEEQWKINFGDIPFVRKLGDIEIDKPVDIIIGSPNCGTSSILSFSRKKSFGKPKEDESINLFTSSINLFKPNVFMMENLPKLLDFIPTTEWEHNFKEYDLTFIQGSVSDFGNSQMSRIRLLIIGVKKGYNKLKIEQFKVFKVRPLKLTSKLMEANRFSMSRFPLNGNVRETGDHKVCMYDYRDKDKTKLNLAQIQYLWTKDFNDCYKWPINSEKMKTLPGVYRNNGLRFPMTARKQDRQFRPDGFIMSPGELAVIQGLPNRYKIFCLSDTGHPKYKYWINKGRVSVTKGPVFEQGLWFKKTMLKS